MKAWLLSVVAVCLLIILLELLLSEGTTKKYVQGILRLTIVFAMIYPVTLLIQKSKTEDLFQSVSESFSKESTYFSQTTDTAVFTSEITEKINHNLSESGIQCDVKIILEDNAIKWVTIDVLETGITTEKENINTNEKIIRTIKDILKIDKEKIIIHASG